MPHYCAFITCAEGVVLFYANLRKTWVPWIYGLEHRGVQCMKKDRCEGTYGSCQSGPGFCIHGFPADAGTAAIPECTAAEGSA